MISTLKENIIEPSSEKVRVRPIVSEVFLDRMLENHGSSGILRDSFALLRVSHEAPDYFQDDLNPKCPT